MTFYKPGSFGKKKKMLQFWFHVSFVEDNKLSVSKKDMDKAVKDCKKHKKYSEVRDWSSSNNAGLELA